MQLKTALIIGSNLQQRIYTLAGIVQIALSDIYQGQIIVRFGYFLVDFNGPSVFFDGPGGVAVDKMDIAPV